MDFPDHILVTGAKENNLKSLNVKLPRNKFIVVTGVSGSGKSSLVFDVLYREAESRYLGSLSSYARQFLGKMKRPDVEKIEGLSPAIAVKQLSSTGNQRSTVGTVTGIYDHLRLLFARLGKINEGIYDPDNGTLVLGKQSHPNGEKTPKIDRSLFSFNSPAGACPHCKGLGVEDRIDPDLLIADPGKTLREGALVITTPSGYIIYSQVTMEALDQVCRSEGFHVDIPWKEMTPEQQQIVLYGSNRIEIPYGKHPLESRMRWSGITAKPREMGYYKGIIPVMENILRVDRNKNILRFARTLSCSVCGGTRLNATALSVKIGGHNIASLCGLQLDELKKFLQQWPLSPKEQIIAGPIITKISGYVTMAEQLGLGYLSLNRESSTLSGGELQRLRIASQAMTGLSGLLYIFDEPSVGMHPLETMGLIESMKTIRDKGNTVIVVEHDETFIRHADWIVDIGPGPGLHGGQLLISASTDTLSDLPQTSILQSETLAFFTGARRIEPPSFRRQGAGYIEISGASKNNLKNIHVRFLLEAMNAVTGVSGAGKSTLVKFVLGSFLSSRLRGAPEGSGGGCNITNWQKIGKVIEVDQSPIGRTPRSNPATYTGLFDRIRDLFAAQPRARELGFGKSRFSFNTAGGRCENCEGAGYLQTGMHFMGNVEIACETCEGQRFDQDTLSILYLGKNIFEVLEMTVTSALSFFVAEPGILHYLLTLDELGLGYLTLGQRSSTLSGGEAQRVKLATELAKPQAAHTLYILDQPTTGLHPADVGNLLNALKKLVDKGHTVIYIEHDPVLIMAADHVVDLGPGSGKKGGHVVTMGAPETILKSQDSLTAMALREHSISFPDPSPQGEGSIQPPASRPLPATISFTGVTTHNLRNIDIDIPKNKITVITGVSGSGKSSLAFDTLYAEGQNRFLDGFSTWFRSRVGMQEKASFEEVNGLTATFAVDQMTSGTNPRSTVGTSTGIYDLYRLLYSRIGKRSPLTPGPSSSLFSFNHQNGACPSCDGLGFRITCDPAKLITHPHLPVSEGAMDGTKTGKFYGDPYGQYIAALLAAGVKHTIDYSIPWVQLSEDAKHLALEGAGDETFEITWKYKRKNREGEHQFHGPWPGFIALVDEEYLRKHADHRGESMKDLMKIIKCGQCNGTRLRQDALTWLIHGMNIAALATMPVSESILFFRALLTDENDSSPRQIKGPLILEILQKLDIISGLGLSYLSVDRISSTLSGGEAQRIKLAGQLGSGLAGLTYILDEPTIGLHPRDTKQMMQVIRSLQEKGNTVVIVEHDREVILSADHLIDMGPGAGLQGGNILAQGTPEEVISNPASITGPYLGRQIMERASGKRELKTGLFIRNAFANNLKGFDLAIPAGGIVAITGVSGSGKSSLLFEVILSTYEENRPTGCGSMEGSQRFKKVVPVHPRSGFSTPAGTPVTFTGLFDIIRTLFSKTPDAQKLQFGKNHFSYLNKEGRCPECQGMGKIKVPMDFLADVTMECETCGGTRYREEIRDIKYQGKSIDEVLQMTFSEAENFFGEHPMLVRQTGILNEVGLGYLRLGQALDTLSGGEAQRLALATELMKTGKGETLYLLEEPSIGLHFADIRYLLRLFHQLADRGNTLLVIEHDPDIIWHADWIIELGPEGGSQGGYVVKSGPCR
ncbi:MAG: excinuclease ABC subunit UvrA [Bacteroidales bacterium]|nr:excinuclease ABC subunit UvrA [Bacteroidales bacterium]